MDYCLVSFKLTIVGFKSSLKFMLPWLQCSMIIDDIYSCHGARVLRYSLWHHERVHTYNVLIDADVTFVSKFINPVEHIQVGRS